LTGEFIQQDEEGEWICPKSEEVATKKGGRSADNRRVVHSEEAKEDHKIRTNEEYIWELQKLPKYS
jgi:hypothetical protein